jgi:hypothetical protein
MLFKLYCVTFCIELDHIHLTASRWGTFQIQDLTVFWLPHKFRIGKVRGSFPTAATNTENVNNILFVSVMTINYLMTGLGPTTKMQCTLNIIQAVENVQQCNNCNIRSSRM